MTKLQPFPVSKAQALHQTQADFQQKLTIKAALCGLFHAACREDRTKENAASGNRKRRF